MSQCEHVTAYGQCKRDAMPGYRYCDEHSSQGANKAIQQYMITNKLIGDPAERHAQQDRIKSLVGEIAILRALFERRINQCEGEAELIAATPALKDLAGQIEKLVASTHAMDVKLGNLLNKGALMSLAQDMIGIIDKHIRPFVDSSPDTHAVDDAIEAIGTEIVAAIAAKENS